jgi:glyoxylase-like metal-dependent hydrolase (beta-lactamase superfamily II)/8-oxo-dGTP pyrophosphatase MutT (NUDIX family)
MLRHAVSLAVSKRSRPEELLLVERSQKLRFFGGFLAFPGGTVDEADRSVPVAGLDSLGPGASELAPFVVAGARELLEETGVWLGRGGHPPGPEELTAERRRLIAEETTIGEVLARYLQHLDARDLTPLCRITTPPFASRRYDTWFFRALLDDAAPVEIWDGELVAGDFVAPVEAIERWRSGAILVAPPMIMLMEQWSKGLEGLEDRIRTITEGYRSGKLHRVYFSPGILLVPLKTETQPPATHTNTCIIGEERLFVVDPSPVDKSEQARFFRLLEELEGEGRSLGGILLTHYHPDHVGALGEMQRRYPSVPTYAHEDCIPLLPDVRFSGALEHDDELGLGRAPDGSHDWKIRAYHVPGHAPGHLAFQESRYGAIMVGDLVSTLSSILVDPKDGHLATYMRSLEFLETVANGTLYPGHGPPSIRAKSVIRKTRAHRREREAQILETLEVEPLGTKDLVAAVYADVDPKMRPLAERSLLSGLLKLEEEGIVVREGDRYRMA